jgi:hypothetical protein
MLTFFKPCTVVMDTLKMCILLSGRLQTLFEKLTTVHAVELSHFSSMFWINCIHRHQLIMEKCFRATRPSLFWIDFIYIENMIKTKLDVANTKHRFCSECTCKSTRCVMKHKCPRMGQIPEVAIIVKTQGQYFKIYAFNIKVLSQGTCIWNTKALSLTIQKIWLKLKFLKSGLKVKVTRSKIMVPLECACHKEYTYEIWKPYHLPFKRYGQC